MNRDKVIAAILEEYRRHGQRNQEAMVAESLKLITSDMNLLMFAMQLGIDTDAVLAHV